MRKHTFIYAIAGLLISIAGCKKSDLEAPVVSALSLQSETVMAGTDLTFNATFTDNEALNEYKLDIHDVFDGHSHNKTAAKNPWAYINIFDIEGTSEVVSQSIPVPADVAAGPYDILIQVLDEAGNQGEFAELELVITNNDQAMINLTSHDLSMENGATLGDTIMLAGMITDDVDIVEIAIEVEEHHDHSHKRASGGVVYSQDIDLQGAADMSWDFNELIAQGMPVVIPTTAELGEYMLSIRVEDSDGNVTLASGIFHAE